MSRPQLSEESAPAEYIPRGLKIASEWAVRLLLLAGLAYVLKRVIGELQTVLIPFLIAVLLSALMAPTVRQLALYVPRGLAVAIVTITGIAAVVGVMTFVVQQVISGLPELQSNITASFDKVRDWLVNGPPHLSPAQIDNAVKTVTDALTKNQQSLTTGALTTAGVVRDLIAGILLTFFSLIFLLKDGAKIWRFVLGFVPAHVRGRVDVAGRRGFGSLVSFVRATVLVAFVNALSIGIGLEIMRIPLAVPLAAIVFLFSFIPIIGALLSGAIAIAVALVAHGPFQALIVLIIVIAVHQVEGHVLQPLVMGRAVAIHPLAVVLAIATGDVLGGIAGTLLAVPTVAVVNAMVRSLHSDTMASRASEPTSGGGGEGGGEASGADVSSAAASGDDASGEDLPPDGGETVSLA